MANKQFLLKMPEHIHTQLKVLSAREHRTMSAQILIAIEEHLARQPVVPRLDSPPPARRPQGE